MADDVSLMGQCEYQRMDDNMVICVLHGQPSRYEGVEPGSQEPCFALDPGLPMAKSLLVLSGNNIERIADETGMVRDELVGMLADARRENGSSVVILNPDGSIW